MTDASKRLYDAVDDGVGDAGTASVNVSAVVPPTPINRTMRALQLHPVNTEGNLSAPNALTRPANVVDVRATASSAGVSDATMQLAESLRCVNPSITMDHARMLYPSISLDGGNGQDGQSQPAGGAMGPSMECGSGAAAEGRPTRSVLAAACSSPHQC